MNESDILELVTKYGFLGKEADTVFRLAKDVERQTRQNYFRLMQVANNAASSNEITARELDVFLFNKANDKNIKGD
jgi:hypothetical protein